MKKLFLLYTFLIANLIGNPPIPNIAQTQQPSLIISTDYGNFEVKEPVLRKLFELPALKRTQYVEQYGIDKYVAPEYPSYSRYKHCVGVWALLRLFGASLEEQIAGLLHDVSHTVFSHAGDRLFKHASTTSSYQDTIHEWYLDMMGIRQILQEYGISMYAIVHNKNVNFMLEQPLPDVCADRLEYNLQGGGKSHYSQYSFRKRQLVF